MHKSRTFDPPNIKPGRLVAVIDDTLTPGIQFTQATKSGDVWVLLWSQATDRLYRWDGRSNSWTAIKSDAISAGMKQQLSAIFQP